MRRKWMLFAVLLLGVVVASWRMLPWEKARPREVLTTHTGPTVEQIQLLASLTTLKVAVADAVVTDLRGYLGDAKAVLVVRGDVTLGVDLSRARFEQVDSKAHTAVLVLPQPAVQSVRVDHERTRLIDVRSGGVWMITPGGGDVELAVINRGYRDAQRIVATAADDPGMVERARQQAEAVLGAFFAALGWRIETRWSL